MSGNDNKDIFDYDSYVKSKDKKRTTGVSPKVPKKSSKSPDGKKSEIKARQEKKRDESIENIRRMFDDALDEKSGELAELTRAESEPEMTVNFTATKFRAFADNTQQKTEFARFIYPIVICDPAPFDQTVKLRSDTMITAAIWDIILYEDKSKYDTDFDLIIVPELDVEQHATKLFGSGLSFKHQSIIGADIQFYYNEEIKSYRIPANPKYFTYSPYIEDITRVGESYTITVGYVSPTPAWLTLTGDEQPKPEKYVIRRKIK